MSDSFWDAHNVIRPRTPRQRQQANEPPEDVRRIAATQWNYFCALTREGFTEHQAILLIAIMFNPNMKGDTPE